MRSMLIGGEEIPSKIGNVHGHRKSWSLVYISIQWCRHTSVLGCKALAECLLRGVVGQIQEQANVIHGTVFLEVRLEEAGSLHVDLEKWKRKYDETIATNPKSQPFVGWYSNLNFGIRIPHYYFCKCIFAKATDRRLDNILSEIQLYRTDKIRLCEKDGCKYVFPVRWLTLPAGQFHPNVHAAILRYNVVL